MRRWWRRWRRCGRGRVAAGVVEAPRAEGTLSKPGRVATAGAGTGARLVGGTVIVCSELAEEVVECGFGCWRRSGRRRVFARDGAQGGAGDGVGVGLGDLVWVEGVVVVTDDKRGDVDGPPDTYFMKSAA